MTKHLIDLGAVRLDARELASQGNAILGIRASGKSYLGTLLGERLMDAGIPITAFDPIGVWRFLRIPGARGRQGYPVVVAGGEHGDLPLTPAGAPEIVRAAMREGVSLVVDLYSMKLSKADWRRIVESCVRVLLYENKSLRHVFIEEAAEFAPQQVGREYGQVYAEVEKLARMGGNARLGYTLISQRAEQVNKAVLELCDALFLFRQKGRLSLTALSKWLDIGSAKGGSEIIASLPTLPQGVCWAWLAGRDTPVQVKVPEKRTLHPDRSKLHGDAAAIVNRAAVDVGSFVAQMQGSLEKIVAEAEANDPAKLKARIRELEKQLAAKGPALDDATRAALRTEGASIAAQMIAGQVRAGLDAVATALGGVDAAAAQVRGATHKIEEKLAMALLPKTGAAPATNRPVATPAPARPAPPARPRPATIAPAADGPLSGTALRLVTILAQHHPLTLTRSQLALMAGIKPRGGNWNTAMSRAKPYLDESGAGLTVNAEGLAVAGEVPPAPQTAEERIAMWRSKLPGTAVRILDRLVGAYPLALTREAVGDELGIATRGGNWNTALSTLKRAGVILEQGGGLQAHPDLWK